MAATTSKKLKKINYSGTDLELRDALFQRGLAIPLTEENQLIRAHALQMLRDWEQQHENEAPARKCRVIFHQSGNPSSGPYVYASINEKNFQAPFNKEVVIPEYMLRECIDRAQIVSYREEKDEYNRPVTVEVRTPIYPYTFLGYVEEGLEASQE
jgi:hypothetical protein|nr:MAG TPA: hypothetical protein [Caudoviricetes sp.]